MITWTAFLVNLLILGCWAVAVFGVHFESQEPLTFRRGLIAIALLLPPTLAVVALWASQLRAKIYESKFTNALAVYDHPKAIRRSMILRLDLRIQLGIRSNSLELNHPPQQLIDASIADVIRQLCAMQHLGFGDRLIAEFFVQQLPLSA